MNSAMVRANSMTPNSMTQVRATLDEWRARGAHRINPVRFNLIEALERRAAGYDGDVRRLLDERLAALIAEYSSEVVRADADADADAAGASSESLPHDRPAAVCAQSIAGGKPTQTMPPSGALAELVELVDVLTNRATPATQREASVTSGAPHAHRRNDLPELPVLDYFRETWSRFSTEKQLRQSLEQVPDNAGPLNSHSLVHRSLSLMRALSPGYLQQFLSYVEALSWMEQLVAPAPGTSMATGAAAAADAFPDAARRAGFRAARPARRSARCQGHSRCLCLQSRR